MSAKICPTCGTPKQSRIWQQCHCGYDFGPDPTLPKPPPPRKPEPEDPKKRAMIRCAWIMLAVVSVISVGVFVALHLLFGNFGH